MSEPFGVLRGTPVVEVDSVGYIRGGATSFIQECPLCGEPHTHGFVDGLPSMMNGVSAPSQRGAHCTQSNTENASSAYYLVYTNETEGVKETEDGWFTTNGGHSD